MNTDDILKNAATANVSGIESLIWDLNETIKKLQAARDAFAKASTWTEFDGAVVDVKGAIAHLPKHRDEAMLDYSIATDLL